jgi:uroporphyrinogen-III decarboxylase
MTPKEVVTRAIEFRKPDRLPIRGYGNLSDVIGVGYAMVKPEEAGNEPNVDQWLCRWDHTDMKNMGQVKGHPLEDLSNMRDFPWPDGDDQRRYTNVHQQISDIESDPNRRDKYVTTGIFMILWERMHSLYGFENCMIDLMENTPEINELADRILDYDMAILRNMHRLCGDKIQGFSFTEDWGTQDDLQISPELWHRFFLPRYRVLFDAIHECGWHVWMHSCGKINKAIPGLIGAGLDVINMQQPRGNGIEEIGQQFAGKICFESLCDIQKTLPTGDRREIEEEAEKLLKTWGTPDGGFILGDYGDHVAIGTQPETKQFMLDTFARLDPYRMG